IRAAVDSYPQSGWFEGDLLCDVEGVVTVDVDLVLVEDVGESEQDFVIGELAADAGAVPDPERPVYATAVQLTLPLRGPSVRVETFCVRTPGFRVAVRIPGEHEYPIALLEAVFAVTDRDLMARLAEITGRDRPQPQRFIDHPPQIPQLRDVLVAGYRPVAPREMVVDLGARSCRDLGILRQLVEREGQCARAGLVASDQERQDLVADIGGIEMLAGVRVGG